MVQTPLCKVCLESDILCPADEEKVKRGEITELDVTVARILHELDRQYRIGDEVKFISAHNMGSFVLVLVQGEVGRLIGKAGKVLRAFRQKVGKPVRIVEVGVDIRKTVQDLFGGVRVLGVNVVYKPDGHVYKVVIPRREVRFLSFPYSDIDRALNLLLDKPHEVVFV